MINRPKNNDRKIRQGEDLDYLAARELRKFRRVGTKAFEGVPIVLVPIPPFFGEPIAGKIRDLSGGGLSTLVNEAFPPKTKLKVWMKLPAREACMCSGIVRRVIKQDGGYLLGLEFVDITEQESADLQRISTDYDACEVRIHEQTSPICHPTCAFFELCDKPEKNH